MILNAIRYRKHYFGLFGRHELTVVTNEGTGRIPAELQPEDLALLQQHIPQTALTTLHDLSTLRATLPGITPATYALFERALLTATPTPWKLFGKETINQLPRPLCTIAQTPDSTTFHLFAPDATNIVHTLLAYETIYDTLAKNQPLTAQGLISISGTTEHALDLIDRAIHTHAQTTGMTIKKGMTLAHPITPEHARHLIDTYDLAYIENPFPPEHEETYATLTAHAQHHCYITTASPTLYTAKKTNACTLTYQDALTLQNDITRFPADKHNFFLTGDYGLVPIASSLTIPVLLFPLKSAIGKELSNDYLTLHNIIRAHNHNGKTKDL